jgi:hypothetical protein
MPYRTEMYVGADLKRTTLSAGIGATDTTIPAVSLAGWPMRGYAAIFTSYDPTQTVEIIEYTGISGNSLTGVTRGHAGTQQAWPQGAYLEIVNDWHYFQRIIDNVNELFPAEGVTRVRGNTPHTRYKGTETNAKEYRLVESAGKLLIQENTGTEDAPTWTTRFVLSASGLFGLGQSSPHSTVHAGGSFAAPVVIKTADYTASAQDYTILCDATGGAITISLPSAVGIAGRVYNIKKIDSSDNAVTIDPAEMEAINGEKTVLLTTCWQGLLIQSDGANWVRLDSPGSVWRSPQ